ncbi:hypothetical protein LTR86_010431 [Recurvomyces mirabilis]|nr:hypothetical protein LTR86_010431 [Recurvomyces mirabilis]
MARHSSTSLASFAIAAIAVVSASPAPPRPPYDGIAYKPKPYTIYVPPSTIDQISKRVAGFRPTQGDVQSMWLEGPPNSNLSAITTFWAQEYDWTAVQSAINSEGPHFMSTVPIATKNYNDTIDIHLVHRRSAQAGAIPLLMLHGWPSTSREWRKVIPDLVTPSNSRQPAFHVVAPDIPGFGFSPAPRKPGFTRSEYGAVFVGLMQQLGYDRFGIYSTDLGWVVAMTMVEDNPDQILNHITDFYLASPNATDVARFAANETDPEETAYINGLNVFYPQHGGYSSIQSTLPLSIASALNDSPVGSLAWVYQLVYTVSDRLETTTDLITRSLLLYLPGVCGNIRSYTELFPFLDLLTSGAVHKSNVSTSVLQFGGVTSYSGLAAITYVPPTWIERTANLTFFRRYEKGGHFPAESEPGLVVDSIRAVFVQVASIATDPSPSERAQMLNTR